MQAKPPDSPWTRHLFLQGDLSISSEEAEATCTHEATTPACDGLCANENKALLWSGAATGTPSFAIGSGFARKPLPLAPAAWPELCSARLVPQAKTAWLLYVAGFLTERGSKGPGENQSQEQSGAHSSPGPLSEPKQGNCPHRERVFVHLGWR